MPQLVYDIIGLIASLFRFIGLGVFGLGFAWLALDLVKRNVWQVQIAVFLGMAGLMIGLSYFLNWGALGAFGIGAGVAFLLWGMPKKVKVEDEKKK